MAMKWLVLLLSGVSLLAQPARMKVLQWEFPSNEAASVFFWVERKEGAEQPWVTVSVVDLQSGTNAMAFFRVGADWRTNAPAWMTNFQFVEIAPEPKLLTAPTAGSKTGKLTTALVSPTKTYRAVPMPPPIPR